MGIWKTKVLPNLKKVFQKSGKKAAAAEASKSFNASKEEINKEFEEKKTELSPKVIEIYDASSVEIKSVLKEPKEAGIKKHSDEVHKVLEKLGAIDFPGSKLVCEASKQFGPGLVSGPVLFLFEKVSTVLPEEVAVVEKEAAPAQAEVVEAATTTEEETPATATIVAEREIVAVEEPAKKESVVADKQEEIKTIPPPPTTTTTTTPVEEVAAVVKTDKTKAAEPVPVPKAEPVKTPEVVAPVAVPPPTAEPTKP